MIRCFAAVEVPAPAVRRALEGAQGRLRQALGRDADQVKWVPSHQFHFTLRFFGEIGPADVEVAAGALRRAAAATRPFRLEVAGLGAFPSPSRPSVLWAGTGEGRDRLVALAGRVEDELAACGFAREARPFLPHLTLGRVRRGAVLPRSLQECLAAPPVSYGSWPVERLVLMRSDLMPAGPRYTVLAAAELMRGE